MSEKLELIAILEKKKIESIEAIDLSIEKIKESTNPAQILTEFARKLKQTNDAMDEKSAFLDSALSHDFFRTSKCQISGSSVRYISPLLEVGFLISTREILFIKNRGGCYYLLPMNPNELNTLIELESSLSKFLSKRSFSNYIAMVDTDIQNANYNAAQRMYKYLSKRGKYTEELHESVKRRIKEKEEAIAAYELSLKETEAVNEEINTLLAELSSDLMPFIEDGWYICSHSISIDKQTQELYNGAIH